MPRAAREHNQRNGSTNGYTKYQCKACGHKARFVPAAVAKVIQYAQVEIVRRTQLAVQHRARQAYST